MIQGKVLVGMVLAAALFAVPASGLRADAAAQMKTYSLDSAVLVGLKDSPQVEEIFVDYRQDMIDVERLQNTVERGPSNPGLPGYTDTVAWELSKEKTMTLTALQAESTRLQAEATLRQELQTYVQDVKSKFLSTLQAREKRSLTAGQLERAERQEANARVGYEAGTVALIDYEQAQTSRKQAQVELQGAEMALQTATLDLKQVLGLGLDDLIQVEGTISRPALPELDEQADIASALANNPTIIQLRLQRDVALRTFEIEEEYLPSTAIGYRENEAVLQKARLQLEQAEDSVAFQVRSLHLQLQQLDRQVDVLNEIVDQAARSLDVAEARYRAGMATTLDVMQAQLNLRQSELNRLDGIFKYLNALESRNVLVGAERRRIENRIRDEME